MLSGFQFEIEDYLTTTVLRDVLELFYHKWLQTPELNNFGEDGILTIVWSASK